MATRDPPEILVLVEATGGSCPGPGSRPRSNSRGVARPGRGAAAAAAALADPGPAALAVGFQGCRLLPRSPGLTPSSAHRRGPANTWRRTQGGCTARNHRRPQRAAPRPIRARSWKAPHRASPLQNFIGQGVCQSTRASRRVSGKAALNWLMQRRGKTGRGASRDRAGCGLPGADVLVSI